MFPNFIRLIAVRAPPDGGPGFVEEVRVLDRMPARNRRVEKLMLACWLAITVKCGIVVWLVERYHMPFNPWWINGPTLVFALICTAVYFLHE